MFERIRIYLKYETPELIDKFFIGLCLSLIIVCAVGGGMLTFRKRKRSGCTQLDARGLQASRRQAAAQAIPLDDSRKILQNDGLTL